MKTKIYALRDETRYLRYVGKTTRLLTDRLSDHLKDAQKGVKTHKCSWIRSMMRCGLLPSITLIEEADGNGNKEEIKWIKYFRDHGIELVNGTEGGEGWTKGMLHKEGSKEKMRCNRRGKGLGYSPSEKNKEAVRLACKGKPRPASVRLAISLKQRGRKKSAEARKNMSIAARKRVPYSEEYKQNMSYLHKSRGQRPTPACIALATEEHKNREWTSESRMKSSTSAKKSMLSRSRDSNGRLMKVA